MKPENGHFRDLGDPTIMTYCDLVFERLGLGVVVFSDQPLLVLIDH